jgi:tetratricopeptide (TPR) repeat protein
MSANNKPTVFISYSHKDEDWKNRLRPHLKVLEQAGRIVIWDDRDIDAGAQWYNHIMAAMETAAVAVCLISADYLASDFCTKEEIPYLLERRERDGMLLLPVLLRPCPWKVARWLEKTQMIPRDGKSITKDFRDNEDEVFALVAETIFDKLENPDYRAPVPPPPRWSPPEKVETGRLPVTGAELFGRQGELEWLDAAWSAEATNVVSLVAWGGVGKSTLVNKWLERMEGDNYRGARRVYAWSFYSQGTGERVTSADQFINDALKWFGDADPTAGSPWDKGERLARLVRRQKTLLLLDGLEPLQSPHAHERGKIKDPALLTLLTELARQNPGLCLITTRERVIDLAEFEAASQEGGATVLRKDLEQISDEAGRALLRVGGAQGTDAELEQATRDFGNHALAVQLLAVYLRDLPGHHVSHAAEIPDLDLPEAAGRHPRRLLAAFARRFGDGPEVELLRMLGLFDRPADAPSLEALRAAPPIPALTDHVHALSDADWLRLVEKLRRLKLIAPAGHHGDTHLDAHPLVREHFGKELKQHHPVAWREGNNRLYEHLTRTTKEFPDTFEEMAPLYAAIAHGCEAGRHQEALDDVYWRRVARGDKHFSTNKLGAYGADLTAIRNFFDSPWLQPVSRLTEQDQGYVVSSAGFILRGLGRLRESTQPMQASLEAAILHKDWTNAAIRAGNLSESHLIIGNLFPALDYAQQSVDFAQQSGVRFQLMSKQTTLADALHHVGRLSEAAEAFREAENMQKDLQAEFPILYSVQGHQYCDLLLAQGKYQEVQARAKQTLAWAILYGSLLSVAVDYLSIGRAFLLQAQHEGVNDFVEATEHLKRAVNGLRLAGTLHQLPRGILAHAELSRVTKKFEQAQADLDEAMSIAMRGSMGLYEADCHLEYARLYLARKENEKARASWEKAKEMIERMGYHRRDRDVREIEEQLKAAGG